MKKIILSMLLLALTLGCSVSKEGITVSVSPQTIQDNIAKQFPIEQELTVGKLILETPKVGLKEGTDQIQTGISFAYDPPFLPKQTGVADISGKIMYNAEKAAVFLLEPKVNELKFNNTSIPSMLSSNLTGIMGDIINEVFRQFPIYKLDNSSFSGKLMQNTLKKAEVKNGELLMTFGLPGTD